MSENEYISEFFTARVSTKSQEVMLIKEICKRIDKTSVFNLSVL